MKVMLCTPPWKTTELWPPLGILYIASNIKAHRLDEVIVLDAFCRNLTKEECAARVVEERPEVVGFNCSTHTFMQTIETMEMIRKELPNTIMVLGGYHATFASKKILRDYPFIDYILKGESEGPMVKLLDALEKGEKPVEVEGITYFDDGEFVDNPMALVENLDDLPFPDRDMLGDLQYGYNFQGIPLTFGKFTTLSTSRGCPFNCAYCSCAAFSNKRWRYRSAKSVVDELEKVYKQGYRECVLVDDNFTHKTQRVEEICRLIRERGIKMRLYCEGRADHADYRLLSTMKKAGFDVIYFGVESANPRILEYYNKKITPDKNRNAIRNAKKANLLVITSFIIGAPIESREEILNTIRFAREARPHGVQFNILDCLIGTDIWGNLEKEGIAKSDDWKTNHRVYEYFPDGLSKEDLQSLANLGYDGYIDGWKSPAGLADLIRIMMFNKTARKIVFGNLFNPKARETIMGGMKAFEGKKINSKEA